MLWGKMRNILLFISKAESSKLVQVFYIAIFVIFFLVTRIPGLKTDVINPDGVNWHYRSEQFIVGLKYHQFDKTFQHYQPGATLMWISGIPIEFYKQITGITSYTVSNFENFDLVAKLSVVLAQLVLSVLIISILASIIGFYKSFVTTCFFTFEPFFVGNSRLYHMDVLFTLLVFLGIIFAFIGLKKKNIIYPILSGFFIALTFLTKSVGIGAVLFVLFYSLAYFMSLKQYKKLLPYDGFFIISFVSFTFLLFPALWVKPFYYLTFIFSNALNVGFVKGHGQIILGEYTRDAGVGFYPLVLLVKSSPFILFGCLLALISIFKTIKVFFKNYREKFLNFGSYISIFYLGYVALMTIPAKKVDRYMIVVYPFLAFLAMIGYSRVLGSKKTVRERVVFWSASVLFVVAFWVMPLITIFPYYFTYTSPLFGSAENANKIVAQKPFGVGVDLLKKHIVSNYGSDSTLGFYDTQPMKAVYANSKVFDVGVYGPGSYDLLVLGVNEVIPDNVSKSDKYVFEKSSSIWINGLEYWRIYVKKAK